MLIIDIKNVEELIFFNKKLQIKFPEFKYLFDQWVMGKRMPILKTLAQKSLMNFLEELKPKHIKILEEYFDVDIKIQELDYHTAKNYKIPIDELKEFFTNLKGFSNNYCINRDEKYAYVTFWR